ncbi:MAG: hypothetical protein RL500_1160 [Pseudomonadota bacterium]
MHSLKAHRLATGQGAQLLDEQHHLARRGKRAVRGRTHAILTDRYTTRRRNLRRHLRAWQHPTVAGLGALAQLDFDHLHLRVAGVLHKSGLAEGAVLVAAAEIARADLPDEISAVKTVVLADRSLPRVVGELALARAAVEGPNRMGRQRAKAHRGNVEDAGTVGLRARAATGTDLHAKVMAGHRGGHERVVDPFIPICLHVELRAERPLVRIALGPLVHQGTLLTGKRGRFVVTLQEVLPDFRADVLEQKAHVPDQRVVAQDGPLGLGHITPTLQSTGQADEGHQPPAQAAARHRHEQPDPSCQAKQQPS